MASQTALMMHTTRLWVSRKRHLDKGGRRRVLALERLHECGQVARCAVRLAHALRRLHCSDAPKSEK